MKKYITILGAFLPMASLGFNMAQFQQCHSSLLKCPMNGPVHSPACVNQLVATQPVCAELKKISKVTSVQADLIDAELFGNLALMTLHYPADGQETYAVVTPDKRILSLNVNPKIMDRPLEKKYAGQLIFTTPLNKPQYKQFSDGMQQFSVTARMNEKCRTCDEIGRINVDFNFNAQGKYLGVLVRHLGTSQ